MTPEERLQAFYEWHKSTWDDLDEEEKEELDKILKEISGENNKGE